MPESPFTLKQKKSYELRNSLIFLVSEVNSVQAVYNIYGIKVADNIERANNLPPGIYIVNGKKFVIK